MGIVLAVIGAIVLHLAFITFGGLVVGGGGEPVAAAKTREVELLSSTEELEKKEEEKKPEETVADDEMEVETEEAPDAAELLRSLELTDTAAAPALDAASLSSISDALLGRGGPGGDFGDAFSFASGGRIGGTGKAGALGDGLDQAFSLAEIDQKPRPIFQSTPLIPSSMKGKKVECVMTLVFVVDASGKVVGPKVEKSSHPEFNQSALDAVKRWKFEPAVRGGQRVSCRMRAPLRFKPS